MKTSVNLKFTRSGLFRSHLLQAGLLLAGLAGISGTAFAGYFDVLNMPVGVTETSADVYALHMKILGICCVIGVLVFAVMFYSMFKHRKSKGAVAATFHESTLVEIIWTVIPMIILVSMAVPSARVLIDMEDQTGSEMTVKVTGYQWRWHYEYLDEGFGFYSQLDPAHNAARQLDAGVDVSQLENYLKEVDNPLVIPVDTKVRFLHTAADVIHAWWLPDLALKKDAIPGFINENWTKISEPGIYRGKCAELCGRDHGFMPVVVHAVSKEEYADWVAGQKSAAQALNYPAEKDWTHEALVEAGKNVYGQNCQSCHQAEGQGIPGLFPAISGSDVATGDVIEHLNTVINGIPDTPMEPYGSRLSDVELAAVTTYQRNALGNKTGDTVYPADVAAARNGLMQSRADIAIQNSDITTGAN